MKTLIISIIIVVLLAGFFHGYNMFHYPYFENDEGTYLAQAYALGYRGKLADYTYWYDHIPGGWMLIAIWLLATGGPFAFGYSLFSGRILMLIVHILSSVLLYILVRKITGKNLPGILAALIFSISPLGIYFQRRLLLDNIMTFWLLSSTTILVYAKSNLRMILFAGTSFALAVISKETAIVSYPGFLLLTFLQSDKKQKLIAMVLFSLPVFLALGYFILYALLKNELLPGANHVSLIGTWAYQLSRSNHLPFWNQGSDFMASFLDWWRKDWLFLIISSISIFYLVAKIIKNKIIGAIGIIALFQLLFMLRGSLVINFYVIPLVAFGSLAIGVAISDLLKIRLIGLLILVLFLGIWFSEINYKPWIIDETTPQIESEEWIKKNLPHNAIIISDYSVLPDLRIKKAGQENFPNAHWYSKAESDPEIRKGLLKNDWQNIDYVILTHELIKQTSQKNIEFLKPTLSNYQELASWGPVSSETYLDLPNLVSTNGDWVKVYRILDRTEVILLSSWRKYLNTFILRDGQVVDPQTETTTSEGQSYAMLRAVSVDDQQKFDLVWMWTKNHFQFRLTDKLFSWQWKGNGKDGKQTDSSSATDADIDIATALILAGNKWNKPRYSEAAKEIVKDIWKHEVVKLPDGKYYLTAGSWANVNGKIYVNPSYISPASFRLFAKIDPEHPWEQLATDSYDFLNRSSSLSKVNLPPDWVEINKNTLQIKNSEIPGQSMQFSYDAMRVFPRISEDKLWFNSKEADEFLKSHQFLIAYYKKNGKIPTIFDISGKEQTTEESNAFYGAFLPYFKVSDEKQYQKLKAKLMRDHKDGSWKKDNNYYTQNWAALGLAIAEGKLSYEK